MFSTNLSTPVVSRIDFSKDPGVVLVLGTGAMAMLLQTSQRMAIIYWVYQTGGSSSWDQALRWNSCSSCWRFESLQSELHNAFWWMSSCNPAWICIPPEVQEPGRWTAWRCSRLAIWEWIGILCDWNEINFGQQKGRMGRGQWRVMLGIHTEIPCHFLNCCKI